MLYSYSCDSVGVFIRSWFCNYWGLPSLITTDPSPGSSERAGCQELYETPCVQDHAMPVLRPLEPVRAVLRFLWSPIRKLRQRIRKSRGPIRNMAALPPTVQKIINDNVYGLPRLPINPLGDTLERYLTSVKPLCTPDEYAAQEKLCAEFQNGVGAQLHADLVSEDAHEGYPFSFIEKHWDVMYNGLRCPAPVNISPFFAINDEKDAKDMVQCARAAKFVHGFTRWTRKVLAGELEQDKDMCSHAYPKHFSSAKIPVKGMDELAMYPDSRHIIVISNGNVFTLEIVSLEGTILEVTGIQAKLEDIVKRAHAEGAGSLPILTAEDRDVWADARASLEAVDGNKDKLQAIDAGIIAVRECARFSERKFLCVHICRTGWIVCLFEII